MEEGESGDVGYWDEEGQFDEEDAGGSEGEDEVSEDAEVGPDVFGDVGWGDVFFTVLPSVVRGQSRADEEVGDAEEEEKDEG